jgi:NAD(P)-dependent dehydrogenase (short-subunit alcohol dehydrogenase family)
MNASPPLVAIVTGASSGIGLGITQALLGHGYRVVATARGASSAGTLKASPELALVDGDISKKETALRVAATAMERFGRIDLLVNNAGIFIPKPFTEYTEEDFSRMVNTNVASLFYMTQQVIPAMRAQKSGHIVNIGTTLVDQPVAGVTAGLPVITKSAMPALSRALAIEYAPDNIRVNTLSPGSVNTPMHANEDHTALGKLSPLGRIAEISELVDAVLYLESAKFVSGENLRIDGGAHAGKW